LDIIKNDSLRKAVVDHFDELYQYLDDLREYYKTAHGKFRDAFENYFIRDYSEKTAKWSNDYVENISELHNDTRLKHRLGSFARASQFLATRIDSLFLVENRLMQQHLTDYLFELKPKD